MRLRDLQVDSTSFTFLVFLVLSKIDNISFSTLFFSSFDGGRFSLMIMVSISLLSFLISGKLSLCTCRL